MNLTCVLKWRFHFWDFVLYATYIRRYANESVAALLDVASVQWNAAMCNTSIRQYQHGMAYPHDFHVFTGWMCSRNAVWTNLTMTLAVLRFVSCSLGRLLYQSALIPQGSACETLSNAVKGRLVLVFQLRVAVPFEHSWVRDDVQIL